MIVTHSRSEALFKFSDKVNEQLLKQGDLVGTGPESNESTISRTKILTRISMNQYFEETQSPRGLGGL